VRIIQTNTETQPWKIPVYAKRKGLQSNRERFCFSPGPDDAVFDIARAVGDQRAANAVQRLNAHVLLGR